MAESKGSQLSHIIGPDVCSDIMYCASYTIICSVSSVLNNFIFNSYYVKYQFLNHISLQFTVVHCGM